jgi:hypothetical protein
LPEATECISLHSLYEVQAVIFVTPLLQGSRYKPYNMRCGRILLGRTKGGVTKITACTFVSGASRRDVRHPEV